MAANAYDDPRFPRRVVDATAGGLVLAFTVWILARPLGAYGSVVASDVVLSVVPMVAAALCWRRAQRSPGAGRPAWTLVALGCLSWGLGNVVWTYYELVRGQEVPFPSPADAFYLLTIPLVVAGMLRFPVPAALSFRRMAWIRPLLDGVIVMGSIFFVSWAFVLGPTFEAATRRWFVEGIGLAYPAGDVVIATIALVIASRAPRKSGLGLLLLAGGFIVFAAADSLFAYLAITGRYETGEATDILWVAGFCLVAMASLRPVPTSRDPSPDPVSTAWQTGLIPYLPVVVAVAAAFFVLATRPDGLGAVLRTTAAATVLVLILRQTLTVAENVELRRDVEDSLAKLKELEAARGQTLNQIAHDLANPISPIRLQLEVLRVAGDQEDRRGDSVAVMTRSVGQLERLVADLKDLARLEVGRFELRPRPADLVRLVADAVATHRGAAADVGIELTSSAPPEVAVVCDPTRINQVMDNLLGNALKFTSRGGHVLVRVGEGTDEVAVSVQDSGLGLTAAQMAKLFKPFSRVHTGQEIKGTGLGLVICKGIVEAHGGRIWVDSPGPGLGATFAFSIPAVPHRSEYASPKSHGAASPSPVTDK